MSSRVLVLGSINLDIVVSAARLPRAGETVLGGALERHPGGKGANQAVAAARAGPRVHMIGAVGDDAEGRIGLEALHAEGIELGGVLTKPGPSGVAIIAVDPAGQNQIVVAPGTNGRLSASDVQVALANLSPVAADVLLASLEVPMEAVIRGVEIAAAAGATVVVNPAPAVPLPPPILRARPILTPNRAELVALAGMDGMAEAARQLISDGARAVVVTVGEQGCMLIDEAGETSMPGRRVERVRDTTGAGDTFSGVLAAWLCDGASLADAARAANAAAALSVRAAGAREGMPLRPDVEAFLQDAG